MAPTSFVVNSLPLLIIGTISTSILAWRVLKTRWRSFSSTIHVAHACVRACVCVCVCVCVYMCGTAWREIEIKKSVPGASRTASFSVYASLVGGTQPPRENKEIDDERALLFESSHIRLLRRDRFVPVCAALFNGFPHVCSYVDQLRPPCASIVPFVARGRVRFRQINRDQSVIYRLLTLSSYANMRARARAVLTH